MVCNYSLIICYLLSLGWSASHLDITANFLILLFLLSPSVYLHLHNSRASLEMAKESFLLLKHLCCHIPDYFSLQPVLREAFTAKCYQAWPKWKSLLLRMEGITIPNISHDSLKRSNKGQVFISNVLNMK